MSKLIIGASSVVRTNKMNETSWLFNFSVTPDRYFGKKKGRRDRITRFFIDNMILRTSQMFEWGGKDWETFSKRIPQRDMELLIQTRGVGGIIYHEDYYYCVVGNVGGKPNWDYMPMQYIVANPYLKLSKSYNIYDADGVKKDVVIIPNDTLYRGVLPILQFHSEVLTEIYLTKRLIMRNDRMPNLLVAPDNNTKLAIDAYIDDINDGEQSSIFTKSFIRDIMSLPTQQSTSHNKMTQVLEMEQYQKAALFNDLGLQMNYNMKRETITSSEAQLGEGALLPLCDDMLLQRKRACEQIKELWGLEITVEFSSAWRDLRKSIETAAKVEESKVQTTELSENGGVNETASGESVSGNVSDTNIKNTDDTSDDTGEQPNEQQVDSTYQEAVEVVEPIIEATREVIEDIAVQITEQEENDENSEENPA